MPGWTTRGVDCRATVVRLAAGEEGNGVVGGLRVEVVGSRRDGIVVREETAVRLVADVVLAARPGSADRDETLDLLIELEEDLEFTIDEDAEAAGVGRLGDWRTDWDEVVRLLTAVPAACGAADGREMARTDEAAVDVPLDRMVVPRAAAVRATWT